MKKEIAFIVSMIIAGAAVGIGIIAIIGAIAVPSYTNTLLTINEKADFELMHQKFDWVAKNPYIILGLLVFFIIVAGILLFANLNPNLRNKFREKINKPKAVIVLLCFLGWFLLLFAPATNLFSSLFSYSLFSQTQNNIAIFLLLFFSTGLLWFIAGETGWAGDFSSWKMGTREKGAKPFTTFIMGSIVGSIAFGILYIYNWSFNKYFILISEVLDKSGEISYLGFKLLAYALIFTTAMSLGIIAGLIIVFSPTYKTIRQRLAWLVFPAILLAVYIPVILGTYQNAAAKYDLGKKNLAEAVGINEKSSVSKTVVLFTSDNRVIQEWPMETRGNSLAGTSKIELTYENLRKVEDYITKHKDGSIYNYAAQDALVNGYHALWDIKNGVKQQFKASEQTLLHRMMLLSRLKNLPITQENLTYLKTFADENKWYIGSRQALRIAEGFMHFGMIKEANAWVNKAKIKGADVSKVKFLNEKVLKNGKVSGTIRVNGKTPANTKIALLRYTENFEKIGETTLPNRLIDVRELDSSGRFIFEHLGKGEYVIALLTNKEIIPYNLSSEKLKVENSAGIIKLNADAPDKKLGDIKIIIK